MRSDGRLDRVVTAATGRPQPLRLQNSRKALSRSVVKQRVGAIGVLGRDGERAVKVSAGCVKKGGSALEGG